MDVLRLNPGDKTQEYLQKEEQLHLETPRFQQRVGMIMNLHF